MTSIEFVYLTIDEIDVLFEQWLESLDYVSTMLAIREERIPEHDQSDFIDLAFKDWVLTFR